MCLHAIIELLVAFENEPLRVAAVCTRCDNVKLRPATSADSNLPMVGDAIPDAPDVPSTSLV